MKKEIALGFHGCIDFECEWNSTILQELIHEFSVTLDDLTEECTVDSERTILTTILRHMLHGIGGEFVPTRSSIVNDFAERFDYRVTIGGTAARAAIALDKIGISSALQICCNNDLFKQLLPEGVQFISSIEESNQSIYPHVSLQYPAGCQIHLLDGSFITSKPNRILFSRDPDSIAMRITDKFYPMISEAKVFLLSCFSEMLDESLLLSRLKDTINTIKKLPNDSFVFMEDGCYEIRKLRFLVHKTLAPYLNAISMNEDEFFDLLGHPVDLLNSDQIALSVKQVYQRISIPNLIIHTSLWALAYGKDAKRMEKSLQNGVAMASTRFRLGDAFTHEDFIATNLLEDNPLGSAFCSELRLKLGGMICCVPGKELSHVKKPTTVGLGDFFAGGLASGFVS